MVGVVLAGMVNLPSPNGRIRREQRAEEELRINLNHRPVKTQRRRLSNIHNVPTMTGNDCVTLDLRGFDQCRPLESPVRFLVALLSP
jgi:hypothetical protein